MACFVCQLVSYSHQKERVFVMNMRTKTLRSVIRLGGHARESTRNGSRLLQNTLVRALSLAFFVVPFGCSSGSGETAPTASMAAITGSITISGQVKNASGAGIPGVTITLAGTARIVQTTGTNGTYAFTQLVSGSYSLQPSSSVCTFTPTVVNLSNVNSNVTQNFTASGAACSGSGGSGGSPGVGGQANTGGSPVGGSGGSGGQPSPTVGTFALLAAKTITLGDRDHVSSGDVGVGQISSGTPYTFVAGQDDRIPGDIFASSANILDRSIVGNVHSDHLVAPNATKTSLTPFTAPPTIPSETSIAAGTTAVTVAPGTTRSLAPGAYGTVNIQGTLTLAGTLNLSGGTYAFASLTLGPGAVINVAAPSVVQVASTLTASDRNAFNVASGLDAHALKVVVGASGANAVHFGTDAHLTAIILASSGAITTGDRLILNGAAAAQTITSGNDGNVTLQGGFGCSVDSECNDNNACTQDTCSNGFCTNTNVADGTTCNDGNACTQTDTCSSGTCVGSNPVVCTAQDACHVAGTCDSTSGQCSNPNAPDGTPCSNGVCAGGACILNGLKILDSGGNTLFSTNVPTNNTYAYSVLAGDLGNNAPGDNRTISFTPSTFPPGQNVIAYDFPYGFTDGDEGGSSAVSDVLSGNWPCLPTNYWSLQAPGQQTVTANGVSVVHLVRYVEGTCRAKIPWVPVLRELHSQVVNQVNSTIQGLNVPDVVKDILSVDFFQVTQPQFRSQGSNLQMGILYEGYFKVGAAGVNATLSLDPAFSIGLRQSDGLFSLSTLASNVTTIGVAEDTVRSNVRSALETVPFLVDTVNSTLSPTMAQLVSVLGLPANSVTTTCSTPTPAAPSPECFNNVTGAIANAIGQPGNVGLINQLASQVFQPINFTCDNSNQCRFHPVFQAVNVLPDSLEIVLAPDLRNPANPANDILTQLVTMFGPVGISQAVTIGGTSITVSVDCSIPAASSTSGTIATVFTGDTNLGAGIACGSIAQFF